jgi:4,5-dihydroxyphthalate decarboxylase
MSPAARVVASFACGRYDRTEPIQSGEIAPVGMELVPLVLHPADTFLRLTRDAEFDIAEMSLSGHIMRTSRGDDRYVGLPIFTSRAFRHRGIVLRSEVADVADLAGRRVAVPEYHMTAALFMRGLLGDEFGFDHRSVTWVQAGQFSPGRVERESLRLPPEVRVEVVTDRTIDQMLASGDVQAATTPYTSGLAGQPDSPIRPLFADPLAAETDYLARTGIFPIMHLVVVRRTLVERHPWVVVNLMQAFTRAKDLCLERMQGLGGHPPVALPFFLDSVARARSLLGDDLWPYGVEPNRTTLEAACRYSCQQGLSDRLLTPEDLFAPATLLPAYLD